MYSSRPLPWFHVVSFSMILALDSCWTYAEYCDLYVSKTVFFLSALSMLH